MNGGMNYIPIFFTIRIHTHTHHGYTIYIKFGRPQLFAMYAITISYDNSFSYWGVYNVCMCVCTFRENVSYLYIRFDLKYGKLIRNLCEACAICQFTSNNEIAIRHQFFDLHWLHRKRKRKKYTKSNNNIKYKRILWPVSLPLPSACYGTQNGTICLCIENICNIYKLSNISVRHIHTSIWLQ